jgi:hypothetical protein
VDAKLQEAIGVPALIGERARNLFLSWQMYCSGAVLVDFCFLNARDSAAGGFIKTALRCAGF